jgi:hypothetical protein
MRHAIGSFTIGQTQCANGLVRNSFVRDGGFKSRDQSTSFAVCQAEGKAPSNHAFLDPARPGRRSIGDTSG